MNQHPKISVIMPVYNESIHDLRESIRSILNQTYHNLDYIIIDDNPNNMKIRNFLIGEKSYDERIRLIFHKYNHGLIYSENEGIKDAKGLYIARLDADDIAKKARLLSQLKFLKLNNLDLVCSNFSIINMKDEITRIKGYIGSSVVNQEVLKHKLIHCNIVINPTLFFKKSIFNKLKGYRNTHIKKCNVEDYDLAIRALIYKFRVGYLNVPLIYKRLRRNSISEKTIFSQYVIMRTIEKFLYKTHFTRCIPLNIIRYNLKNISSSKVKKFHKFVYLRYLFNDHKSIKCLLLLVISIITSLTVFKWCLWSVKNKLYQ